MKTARLVFGLSTMIALAGSAVGQTGTPETTPTPAPVPTTETAITGPQIVFENERATFGKCLDTDFQTVTFKFRNVGSAELRVGEATTLAETVVVMPMAQRTFGPGESGEMVVKIDPQLWRGPITTSVKVPSNSPGEAVRLLIDGFVEKTVNIEPTMARLGWIKPGQPGKARLVVTGRTADFKVTGVKTQAMTGPKWNIQIGEPETMMVNEQPLRRVTIEIASDGPLPEGKIEDTLEITTNDPRRALMTTLMRGWVGNDPPPKVDVVPVMSNRGKYSTGTPVKMPVRDPNNPGQTLPGRGAEPAPAPAPAPAPDGGEPEQPKNP
ncbi:MAG: DUF1573 domain-containing protein [Phycisphaerales bacterium]